jgi:hypothetical protein
MTTTNLSNFQQALINSQVTQQHWIDGGWEALSNQLEEELASKKEVLDVYPYVELDISVHITIVLPDKVYRVPLEDVSSIHVNDSLVISVEDLYPNWKERVRAKIEKSSIGIRRMSTDKLFIVTSFLGTDDKIRILKEKVTNEQ